ncbi:unnamed protein product, partial [Polarella glacialis]
LAIGVAAVFGVLSISSYWRRQPAAAFLAQPSVKLRVSRSSRLSRSGAACGDVPVGDEPTEWEDLQKAAEASGDSDVSPRLAQAGELLLKASLRRLRPFAAPAGPDLLQETSEGIEAALEALLGEDVPHAVDFLSDPEQPGEVSRVFWQAELYLRQL